MVDPQAVVIPAAWCAAPWDLSRKAVNVQWNIVQSGGPLDSYVGFVTF